ncbi:MAG: ATP-binding protein [Chitinophagaceae bacterium]
MQIDYSKYHTTPADPEASSMIETFRAIGYSIQAAIADIIDNSISAGAKNIHVDFEWKGNDSWLSIRDDGSGMDNGELIQAMRPGSRNPNEERNLKDLGRFGLGLKTASFSQCRKLSVISKKPEQHSVCWTWDLDFVSQKGKWDLIDFIPQEFENSLQKELSGTVVVWNDLDRLVRNLRENDKAALDKFLQIMETVKKHLAMVFHRFIESKRVKIFFQQRLVEAWDPFLIDNSSTQKFSEDPLQNNKVRIRGFVLPHKSRLTEEEFRKAEGPGGWNAQQGFYIYRNERLLLAGDWLGMFRKEEHYKLARIMVDLPNNLDAEWQIDIKKSVARPPIVLRDQLKAYANKVRSQAVEVYRHKGKVLQRKYATIQYQPLWQEKIRHGKRFYEINREHPYLKMVVDIGINKPGDLNNLLKFIEETVPVPLITIKESEQPELQGQPFEDIDQEPLRQAMSKMYDRLVQDGRSKEQAKAIIINIEPFNLFPHFVETLT